ncbi:tetrahydromethanopterin S-methyltransferase subunit H [Candidatus Bathyarchaeota archaeon]|nr:tetrahydromethanopterin S-methyltransferase subunit H [Candidatus Bathyarchaeota archaeon]
MWKFEKKQQNYDISGIKIGGNPGERPTVLIGNLFYRGMPEVYNHKNGSFDKKAIEKWLSTAEVLSEESGAPHLLDIMAMYPEAIPNYINFVADHDDSPFLIDGANKETRIRALKAISELGLQERVIFNGITPKTSKEELLAIRSAGVKTAVIMAYDELDYTPEGRISALQGTADQEGLLAFAEKAGIQKVLVDTIVFDIPSISYAAEAIRLVKEELGYPSGCSPANATFSWKQASGSSRLVEGFSAVNASVHTIAQLWGADFLIYGPIKQAKFIIPSCAINDAVVAYYSMKRLGTKPLKDSHPLFKVF